MAPATKDVHVYDPSVDSRRKFPLRVMTRAAKRETREALRIMIEFKDELPDNPLEVTGEQEDRATRLMCDVIDAGTQAPKDDGTPAGTLLYEGWIADLEQCTDDEITTAFETVVGFTQDSPPPT